MLFNVIKCSYFITDLPHFKHFFFCHFLVELKARKIAFEFFWPLWISLSLTRLQVTIVLPIFVCWKQFWPLQKIHLREQVWAYFEQILGLIEDYSFIKKLMIAVWLQNFFCGRSTLVTFFEKKSIQFLKHYTF